jgi:integrase
MKKPLTVAGIRALEPQARLCKVTDRHGLALEIRPSGTMTWRLRYTLRRKRAEINLGRYPQMSLASARARCVALRAAIAEGRSPADQRRMEKQAEERGETVKAFADRYMQWVKRNRLDLAPIRRYFVRDIFPIIGDKPVSKVSISDLRGLIFKRRDEGKEQAALALRNLLKRLFDYAVVCELVTINPLAAIPAKFVAGVSNRTRALNPKEIAAFLNALDAARIKRKHKIALQLILLTLTRKSELRLAEWKEFNLSAGEWEIPPEHSKTKAAQIVYLSRQACALLASLKGGFERSGCVFPAQHSDSRTPMSASTLNRALGSVSMQIAHFTVHDLRRTAATNLSEQEFNSDWIEKALNHKIKGVRGVYNRAQYATQRRTMLQAWADWLDTLRASPDRT